MDRPIRRSRQGLGFFIRSLVGLDREAAMRAFSDFLTGSTATPDQIEFIELVVQELTANGAMEPDRLFQSPFTDISSQGPLGIFPPARVSSLVAILSDIRQRAVAWCTRESSVVALLHSTPLLRQINAWVVPRTTMKFTLPGRVVWRDE